MILGFRVIATLKIERNGSGAIRVMRTPSSLLKERPAQPDRDLDQTSKPSVQDRGKSRQRPCRPRGVPTPRSRDSARNFPPRVLLGDAAVLCHASSARVSGSRRSRPSRSLPATRAAIRFADVGLQSDFSDHRFATLVGDDGTLIPDGLDHRRLHRRAVAQRRILHRHRERSAAVPLRRVLGLVRQSLALRARIVLSCASGKHNGQVADELKVKRVSVEKW